MKKLTTLALLLFVVLVGCDEKKSKGQRIVPSSSGNINELLVVADNLLWEDSVGESIRGILAAPVHGLSQDEPLFSISQMPTQVFSGFTTKNRTILKIEKGKAAGTKIAHDVFAKPQTVIVVSGQTDAEIIEQLETNADKIVDAFKKEEIKEKQRRINLSLFDSKPIEDKLGVSIKFPSVYRIATATDDFFWIRKDIQTGNMDLMIYEVPLDRIRKGDSAVIDIVRMRDSIGEKHIQGRLENTYMITEKAYAPYIFETIIDNKPTIETKGIWEVKNDFMSGPFINYAIEDEINKRYIVVEGYVFAPSINKRDYIFELESIIRSTKIK
ncbi:DUF4837 domain-containing protein [Meridianimaribacter sp. CL38]|uniref:DUF4837 family protein n=1 Tax=Meridianimaribacter sp. CL38 TaxID=2213021 RepID=UPI00103BCC4F|nr:DUF4837 family protein [Meridianimaribacter sp. CL38]TBV28296.1 DUF4837 domain-containing protein [Meridianimaribacter sp. CL38]